VKPGKAIVLGDNIDTDQILGAHRLTLPSVAAMAPYAFEHHKLFQKVFEAGDIIVAGNNFGCGSSREQASAVLKERGVSSIVAKGFARIFYRNAINLGLRLIECPIATATTTGDQIKIAAIRLRNLTTRQDHAIEPLPAFLQAIVDCGGATGLCRKKKE